MTFAALLRLNLRLAMTSKGLNVERCTPYTKIIILFEYQ